MSDNFPMGHSQTDKIESHERIVKVAAGVFRELGIYGVSVADVMKAAGLTHGGFYKHFASRDELVDEAVEAALADGSTAANAIAANPRATVGNFIDVYLSLQHRDHIEASCAVTALASDMPLAGERSRNAYSAQVLRYLDIIGGLMPRVPEQDRRALALEALATMVGALSMARAVNDDGLSREILETASAGLKARLLK